MRVFFTRGYGGMGSIHPHPTHVPDGYKNSSNNVSAGAKCLPYPPPYRVKIVGSVAILNSDTPSVKDGRGGDTAYLVQVVLPTFFYVKTEYDPDKIMDYQG